MTLPKIQKAIVSACAQETVKAIINDLDRDYFGILVDESKDISHHEQISFVLRYVEKKGQVNESFIGLVRVGDTSAKLLKEAIISLLMKHSLSPSKIRGQGYDGASNMQGKMNGLKALILQETTSAHCIHCFAHQLQLTLVAVTKKHKEVETFFVIVANVLNVIGASFKCRDKLRDHQAELLERLVESGEVQSGKELNQERGLQRPDDTRWGSHCKTLDNFLILFASIVHVLGVIEYEGSEANDRLQAEAFLSKINSFKFVFMLHLMLKELKSRFEVVSSNLLLGMGSLNLANSFANFDKERVMTLAKYYPDEFSELKLRDLSHQFDTFIWNMKHGDPRFSDLKGIGDLAKTLVEANLVETYALVYLLVKLTLMLHVATATVERAFSSMKYIKDELHSSIGDAFLNDCLVCYFEKEVFANVKIPKPVNVPENNSLKNYGKGGMVIPSMGVPPQNPESSPEPFPKGKTSCDAQYIKPGPHTNKGARREIQRETRKNPTCEKREIPRHVVHMIIGGPIFPKDP
uniref:Uncharacterized protein LOC104229163 n=1 Tax=Nicotiana sylvestris TaxID=4096 RepID=A0A1U7WJE2_NICSY|nr:PREDICTED: uncharacterized protein LOC104229163 [Nicotiana sylvestris]